MGWWLSSSSHCARGAPISHGVERAACALTAGLPIAYSACATANSASSRHCGPATRAQTPVPYCGYRGVGRRLRGVRQGFAFAQGPGVSPRAASRSRTSELASQAALQVHHDPRLRKWKEGMAVDSIHVNRRLCRTPSDWIVHTLRISQTINTTTMMVPTNPKPSISLLLRKKRQLTFTRPWQLGCHSPELHRGRGRHARRLVRQTSFTKEVACAEDGAPAISRSGIARSARPSRPEFQDHRALAASRALYTIARATPPSNSFPPTW